MSASRVRAASPDVTFGKAYDSKIMGQIWPFLRPHSLLLVLSLLSYPFAAVFALAQPYLIKIAIDAHLVPKQAEGFGLIVLLFVAALLLDTVARGFQIYLSQLLGHLVSRDISSALFSRLQQVDLAFIEKNPVGRLMTRVTNDVESIGAMFSSGGLSILGDLFTLTGILVIMFSLNAQLTLSALAVIPVMVIAVLLIRRPARNAFRDVQTELARLNSFLNEALNGMSIVQAFRQESAMQEELVDSNGAYRNANFRAIRFDAMIYALVEAIATIAIAFLLLFGASLFIEGMVEIGIFVAFMSYLRRFFHPITELSTKYTIMQSAMASAERCFALLEEEPTITRGANIDLPQVIEVSFDGVFFGYQPSDPVIRGLNLTIKRGEKVAIVGPTGAGKTTIVKLLSRFYEPQEGSISLSGIPLQDIDPSSLRSRIACVLQDAFLFGGSLRDNVTLNRLINEEQLERALTRSRAMRVVERLPEKLDQDVGERGAKLSAGERQLVAFARALVLDPEILVLDEATSSVDPETEAHIQEGLKELIQNRTALIIAHRLSTIKSVDRIVVVVDGSVVEQGTHDELIASAGVYKNLHELQFDTGRA